MGNSTKVLLECGLAVAVPVHGEISVVEVKKRMEHRFETILTVLA